MKMNKLLIKNVLLDGRKTNILIENGLFSSFDVADSAEAREVLDAEGKAILPAFYNTHCHAAMTLLRGYADDMPLKPWLEEYIWPYEAGLKAEDIKNGSKLAVAEMVKTGTVFFNDMYFDIDQTANVVREAGIRACLGVTFMDNHSLALRNEKTRYIRDWKDNNDGVTISAAPHAIYTASEETLRYAARLARETGIKLHIHLSETQGEVSDCIRQHGMSPVRYLDSLGFLGPDVIAAHCVHLDKEEWDILAERGVTVAHCPCSNMKLGSGRFNYELALSSGARVTLATDGCSSNNNLDMREEMKFAALLAKVNGDPSLLPASEVLKWATVNGAEAFGINGGLIEKGRVADAILVDLNNPKMKPCHNIVSNWVYSADSSAISAVICNGHLLKQ